MNTISPRDGDGFRSFQAFRRAHFFPSNPAINPCNSPGVMDDIQVGDPAVTE
ncbi:MAG: hypothetical protein ACM3VT_00485 [Solirubrobacterales bacterium]